MLQTSPGFGELRRYLLATLQPVYRRLGLEEVTVVFTVVSLGFFNLLHQYTVLSTQCSGKVAIEAAYCSGGG